jgi:23S rRNA pseudouridine1911/1915/1917 synthase
MSDLRWTVGADRAGVRLDTFLAQDGALGSRRRAADAIRRGKVFLNDREVEPDGIGTRLTDGDSVRLWMDRPGSSTARSRPRATRELRIVYEDRALLVLDKPPYLLTVPLATRDTPSLTDMVERYLRPRGKRRPHIVHRIDRDTSGLVVFAKDATAQALLKSQFERREPERVYLALVHGTPDPRAGTWRDPLLWDRKALVQRSHAAGHPRAKEAISEFRVIESFASASLIEVRLVTGKRNQIRVQAQLHGHPILGERKYVSGSEAADAIEIGRQALHAFRLAFDHPVDGRRLSFEAPLPADMAEVIARLRRRA